MNKICDFKNKVCIFIKENKTKSYSLLLILFLTILTAVIYFNYSKFSDSLVFEVSGWNFDLWIKKLPYNVKSIDISFSKDLDEKSISKDIFKITPEVPWVVKLKDKNTISYELSEKLTIGQDYTLTISKDIKSSKNDTLENDLVYIVSAVFGPKVTKVLPEEKLEDLGKNLVVFFSLPMVNFTDLDSRDKLPCPIDITPKVEWKCVWTTSSVVEFIPKTSFAWATKYDYKIKTSSWMNYELENILTWSFVTPELQVNLADTFVPKDYINLNFNFPVSNEEITKNLTLLTLDTKDLSNSKWEELNFKVESVKNSETSFLIKPLFWEFSYETNYEIRIKPWLKPKYWNIELKNEFIKNITSTSLISWIQTFKNIYSETWTLIDTIETTYSNEFLSNKDEFFRLNFYDVVSLDKNLFVIKDEKNNKNLDFKISYLKEENEKKEIIDNKKSIKLEILQNLENDNTYTINILKQTNPSLTKDLTFTYKTSPKLKINLFKFIDYSRSCLYVNNRLDNLTNPWISSWENDYYVNPEKFINLSNSWIIKSFSEWQYIDDWQFQNSLYELSFEEKNKKLLEKWYCPEASTWETLYVLQTRLSPNTTYKLNIKNLIDIYSNSQNETFSFNLKTWNLKESDKYVYLSFINDVNVFPKSVPVVLNIQTINTSKVKIDVCEMDENWYINYLIHKYDENFTPACKPISRELDTKLVYWKLTNNKFDLEKDILWRKLSNDFILVKVSAWNTKNSNVIVRTNVSLFVEKAKNKSLLYATDLEKHIEIEWLNLKFYDYNWKDVTIKYSFDKNKKVYVIDDSLSSISYITAKNDKYLAVVSGDDYFSNYDFKYISGQDSSTKDFAYVYSDRPIYRPWDEVQIKWILRQFNFDWYKKSNIKSWTLKIIWDDWQVYRSIDVKIDKNSNFSWSFVIPKDSQLWNFRFEFSIKDSYDYVYTNGWFSIEAYRKPSFKVNIESEKNDVLLWDKVNFKITPKYYFGGKMVNTNWTYSILSQNYFFDGKNYSDYQFGTWSNYFDCVYWGYCNFADYLLSTLKNFKVDANWEFNFDYTFGTGSENAEKIYTFNFDVTDPDTLKTVSNSVSKVVHTTDGYVWLKASYYNDKKNWIYFQAVTLDWEARELPNKKLKIEVYKKDYKQVKKLWVDGIFYNEYSLEKKLENTLNLSTNSKWILKYNAKTLWEWEYELRVSYTWKNKKTFTSSQSVYVAWDEYISWWNDNNTVTELEADKITYKVWEKANFTLKSPVNNWKALIVLEKDDGILDYFIHNIKSYWDKIELKLSDKHYPNVYIKAFLIWSEKWNPLPVYKRALSVVKVLTDYKKLNVSIITDKKNYKPADKMQVTIEVVDAEWKVVPNANGSLSVVDESVLALKWNPRKNPYSFFYDMKRYLWVESYSNLKYLVEKLEVKDVSGWEKWWAWDQVKWWETKKPRWNFKDTAFWLSDFTTDMNWKATITIPIMPDNLTTWVLEAIVSTPEDNKIWVNYETVMTSTPVMIEDNLPRFFWTDDKITFSPVIYNRTGKDDTFEITIFATNGSLKENKKVVLIKNAESQKVEFLFDVKKSSEFKAQDFSQIIISAVSTSNKINFDSIKKIIPIQIQTLPEYTSTLGKTDKISYDEKIALWNMAKDNAILTLNYWGTLFSYLLDWIDFLANYPYWCSEQRTSAIMPNIYIKKLYDITWKEFDLKKKMVKKYIDNKVWYKEISLDEVIKDYLIEIKKFQNIDWWFMYWYDTEYKISDIHLTNYILTSLSEIALLWYDVDKKLQENAKKFLKNEFYKKAICWDKVFENCISLELKSEILLALNNADNKDYEVFKMFKTLDLSKLNNLSKADLISKISNISSLTNIEKDNLKKESQEITSKILSNELIFNPRWAFISASYNSRVYNTAKLLEIIWNIWLDKFKDSEAIIDNMIRFISSSKTNNNFGSTYDNSFIIKSLTTYLGKTNEIKNASFFVRFNLNSEEIESRKIDENNIFENYSKTIDLKNLQNSNIFNIKKEWSWSVYYDLNLKYFVPIKNLKSRDEWFYVEKKYFSFNEYKKIEALKNEEFAKYLSGEIIFENLKYPREVVEYLTPINSWKIWDLVLVYNKVITSEDRNQVALESFIPSWSEIVNTALATENKQVTDIATNIQLDRKEFRDNMYFGWVRQLPAWIYNYSYVIRLTHAWDFKVKPSQILEFYTPEIFGRSSGEEFRVE